MKDSSPRHLSTFPPEMGFMRLSAILAPYGPIPVSRSTWWNGVKIGRFPQPLKLSPRVTVWRSADILALIENPEQWRCHSQSAPATRPARRGAVAAKANEVEKFHDR
jgi:prophage regulatory protein